MKDNYFLYYCNEANCFEEALPLGNGKLGAMFYGRVDIEKISLNIDTLWSGYKQEKQEKNYYEIYKKIKELAAENQINKAEELVAKEFAGIRAQSYLPAGNLFIKIGGKNQDYKRVLNLREGVATAKYKDCESECFVSSIDGVLVYKISSNNKRSFEISLESPLKNVVEVKDDMIVLTGQAYDCSGEFCDTSCISYDRDDTIKYTLALIPETDGEIVFDKDKIKIIDGTELIIYLSGETSYKKWNEIPDKEHYGMAKRNVLDAKKKGFENVKKFHISDFSTYFDRVKIDIAEENSDLPTDEQLKLDEKGLSIIELLFNFGRYLIISSSRKGTMATNLQGIWNERLAPPWGSEYTVNINTEMNYWPVLMCNLSEFMFPLVDLLKMALESGKETAKSHYNCDGFVAHHNIDIWGKTTPSEGIARWLYWEMSSGWLCRSIYEYYEYTNDMDYLKNTAFPIMKEATRFYMEMLEENEGNLILTPSISPENDYILDGKITYLAKYTTMTQAIIMDLFSNMVKICDILDEKELKNEILEKYPIEKINTYKIGSKGQLLEYDKEYEESDPHHRHVSHLYGLYPGESITTDNKELSDACQKSLEIRGDDGTGWSIAWKANLWAKLKNGNKALSLIKRQLCYTDVCEISVIGGGTYANLFCAHPPFQIDGNFGITAAICQMFLQCENNVIKILPALPDEMKNGEICGLKAKGDITINIRWNQKKTEISLYSNKSQEVNILVRNNKNIKVFLEKGKKHTVEA